MENKEILDEIIIGRVEPYIYAFSTNTVPNYLKIGDTYRPVPIRLNEWKKHFPDLKEEYKEKAMINSEVFFRDYAVHKYVEEKLGKLRLKEKTLPEGIYYSNEFFENATDRDIKAAINDIKESYEKNDNKYQYYNARTNLPETFQFKREEKEWKPRPNQKQAIDNFVNARKNGRKNLLMYAVMRFGKSFTSMMCAKEMKAKLVVIVSAKADVKFEWKKTVEIPKNFEEYIFISSDELSRNNNQISEILSSGEKVAVFLTLQDLQGDLIKEKHKDIFKNKIDLLIVDETHFGARAEKYGKILETAKYEKEKDKYLKEENNINELEENLKILNVDMTLHLSGTPYRILMGSEFEKEDIISFCQFSDIVEEQEKWNNENILNDEIKEWDNPYFGFPQMIRFAFNPSKKAKEKLKEYQKNGYTYAFSALFKPQSIKKTNDKSHKKFVNEQEILELLEVIDGSKEDENVLGFLNYDKIKQGKMCRHIVCVLPYCASCDALEELIKNNKDKFKNLNEYEIINISGVENSNKYRTITEIKDKIKKCEEKDIKTLTLTVNRMLTGSTVEQWDTMIYLKDTSSPQEYDQAIFRLQNQYIKKYIDNKDNVIKYNMKPQTLLVDFDPYRMFILQEQKSKIYNVNIQEAGNLILEKQLKNELRISPIITMNKSKIIIIQPKNIMDAVSEYSKEKGVMDEVNDIPVDLKLLDNEEIKNIIEKQAEIGSNQGLSVDNTEEDNGEELDIPIYNAEDNNNIQSYDNIDNNKENTNNKEEQVNYEKKIRTYFARILFYSFLTEDNVISLLQVINSIDNNENNKRIAKNLGLSNKILKIMNDNMEAFKLSLLDYKIQHINSTSHDKSITQIERAEIAIKKFNKISSSEYITSKNACDDIIKMIKVKELKKIIKNNGKILDIASKMGEFTLAIWKYITSHYNSISTSELFNVFYSIPTSSIAYEFTRKIYEYLGLNIKNIANKFNTYDILNVLDENNNVNVKKVKMLILQNKKFCDIELIEDLFYVEGDEKVKFDVVIGNPPYQISDGGAQASAKPIYQHFVRLSNELTNKYSSLIIPSRWFVGGKGLDDFRKEMLDDNHIKELHDCLTPEDIFPSTNIRGGVCYFLRDYNYNNTSDLVKVVTHENEKITFETKRPMKVNNAKVFIRDGKAKSIIDKIINEKFISISQNISSRKPFGLDGNFARGTKYHKEKDNIENYCICYSKGLNIGYVDVNEVITHKEWIDKWKVFIPRANNIGTELNDDNLNSFIGKPKTICTESYLVVGGDSNLTQLSALNLEKYMKTKFLRYLHGLLKGSQDATSKTFELVPMQDFSKSSDIDWSKTSHEIDLQLYKKYNLTDDEKDYIESKIKEM